MQICCGSLEIKPIGANVQEQVQVLWVYQQCEDFLALGPVAKASMHMVMADMRLSLQEGGRFCGIFERETQALLGIFDFVLSGWNADPSLAYLSLLMIALPYRSHGIGKQVVASVEQVIRQDSRVTAIYAGVQVNNPGAVRFWQQLGYEIISGPQLQADQTTTYTLCKQIRTILFSQFPENVR